MPDVYATIRDAAPDIQQRLADVLEVRAAEPEQRHIVESYLRDVAFGSEDRVLDIGCGTGAVTRMLARWPGIREVVGVDPSEVFLDRARELAAGLDNVTFQEADGRALPFPANAFDAVIIHTALTHIPRPEDVLSEAYRVLRSYGALAVCDGDYATMTVALGDFDPLQACVEAVKAAFLNDPWLVRRLPALVESAGFELLGARSHGYMQTARPDYMLTVVDRGADTLASWRRIGPELCAALKAEARRRTEAGEFFGFIGFTSLTARKPA